MNATPNWQPAAYKDYEWIVADPQLLGGTLAIRGTRLAVSLILECLAGGMSLEDINDSFDSAFPPEALPEVLKVASELAGARRVTKSSFVRESLEKVLGKQTGDHAVSCYDLARDLAGSVKGLPRDLADNPKHMKGFGE